jgi:hypothetical protein
VISSPIFEMFNAPQVCVLNILKLFVCEITKQNQIFAKWKLILLMTLIL